MEEDRLQRLEARIAELEHQLERLAAAAPAAPGEDGDVGGGVASLATPTGHPRSAPPEPPDADRPPADATTDRRALLRGAVGAAAGAAAATTAIAVTATPAAAGNGDALEVGSTVVQDQALTTALVYEPAGAPSGDSVLVVSDGPSDSADVHAAVAGIATGALTDGVHGRSDVPGGAGVHAVGGTEAFGVFADGLAAPLYLRPRGTTPTGGTHFKGEVRFTDLGRLLVCVSTGEPGTWREVASPSTVTALKLHGAPVRAYDSRAVFPPFGVTKGKLSTGQSRTLDLTVNNAVPAAAVAALVNLTAADTSVSGYLQLYQAGAAVPSSSTLNWGQAGIAIANSATVALDESNRCTVTCGGTGGQADVVLDVVGYYI